MHGFFHSVLAHTPRAVPWYKQWLNHGILDSRNYHSQNTYMDVCLPKRLNVLYRMVNEDGITRRYTPYARSPYGRRCKSDWHCKARDGSGALWCDTTRRRCAAMVEPQGECTGMPHNACRCPKGTAPECRLQANSVQSVCSCRPKYQIY